MICDHCKYRGWCEEHHIIGLFVHDHCAHYESAE